MGSDQIGLIEEFIIQNTNCYQFTKQEIDTWLTFFFKDVKLSISSVERHSLFIRQSILIRHASKVYSLDWEAIKKIFPEKSKEWIAKHNETNGVHIK